MLRHVVLFTWTPDTTETDVAAIATALRSLPAQIPEIRAYDVGANLGLETSGDFAIVADFEDQRGFEVYRDHPVHKDVGATFIRPHVAARMAVQYEVLEPSAIDA